MNKSILAFIVVAIGIAVTPFVADNYIVKLATFVAMYAALASSWNFIGGYTGYPSFATAAFIGIGSYAGALIQNAGLHMVIAWLLAAVITAAFAAVLGFAILRVKGHYFAVGSISVVEVTRLIASSWSSLTGGGDGLNVKIMAGGPDFAGRVFLYAMLAVMVMTFIVSVWVERSRFGFGLKAIKQNEDAADMVGVNVNVYKIAAFTLSAVFCGMTGAIYASWIAYIAPTDAFSILTTLKVPVMALLGGEGTIFGPILGALVFVVLEESIWARFLDANQAILGLTIVILIFFLPGGLLKINYRNLKQRVFKNSKTSQKEAVSKAKAASDA
jgi:branched-chain amino acid transport system permease protein